MNYYFSMATQLIEAGAENLVEKKIRKPRATKKVPVEPMEVVTAKVIVEETVPGTKKRKRASGSGESKPPVKKAKQEEITLDSLKEEINQLQFLLANYMKDNDRLVMELYALQGRFPMNK